MQSGELIVTGHNSIHIPLEKMPHEAWARFKDEPTLVPCDPHNVDWLEYSVHVSHTTRSGFVLLIKWGVSSVREIVWHVRY